jgi:cell division protein FtsQ
MKIFLGFMSALDAGGEEISHKLSEVDVSNPEDVKAIIPDISGHGPDILVHFGEEKFLERYHAYQNHLAEWKQQYPKLTSVDMRYERQVVLEMQPGTQAPLAETVAAPGASAPTSAAKTLPAKVPNKSSPHKIAAAKKNFVVKKAKPKARSTGAR